MTATSRTALAVVWLALLVVAGWLVSQRLEMSGAQDINSHAPNPDAARAACDNRRAACFSPLQQAIQA